MMRNAVVVSSHRLFKRALLTWLILIAAELLHGTLRAIFLVPISRSVGQMFGATSDCSGTRAILFCGHDRYLTGQPLIQPYQGRSYR